MHPPAGYLGEAEKVYAVLTEEVLRKNSMSHVYTGTCTQVYTRGSGLLTGNNGLLPETRIAQQRRESLSQRPGTR